MSNNSNNNINNLNVFTFIKDIYQSLKHIDKCFNDFNTNINTRITKIEDNQQVLIDKLSSIEILLNKVSDMNTTSGSLNKNIENELLEKMNKMNSMNNNKMNSDYKVELKPDELTFANILENNYSFLDINSSLTNPKSNSSLEKDSNMYSNMYSNLDTNISNDILSCSSGSSYYSNSGSSIDSGSSSIHSSIDGSIDSRLNIINNSIPEKTETLNSLLF